MVADQITIVKGANAVRYGSDALGGVILIAPKKLPYGDGMHGRLLPSFASNGRKSALTASIEGSVPKRTFVGVGRTRYAETLWTTLVLPAIC